VSSKLKAQIQGDLNRARKERDRGRTLVLSTLLSEARNREIEIQEELDDDGMRGVLAKAIKQRKDAAEQMREGGREELAENEEAQAEILSEYLPPPLSEDDVREMIRAAIAEGADAMGPVMGKIMPQLRGRFDGKEANRLVREELGQ
jgi:uncharacterized protein YqeY